jgi:hypothetical protein
VILYDKKSRRLNFYLEVNCSFCRNPSPLPIEAKIHFKGMVKRFLNVYKRLSSCRRKMTKASNDYKKTNTKKYTTPKESNRNLQTINYIDRTLLGSLITGY